MEQAEQLRINGENEANEIGDLARQKHLTKVERQASKFERDALKIIEKLND